MDHILKILKKPQGVAVLGIKLNGKSEKPRSYFCLIHEKAYTTNTLQEGSNREWHGEKK